VSSLAVWAIAVDEPQACRPGAPTATARERKRLRGGPHRPREMGSRVVGDRSRDPVENSDADPMSWFGAAEGHRFELPHTACKQATRRPFAAGAGRPLPNGYPSTQTPADCPRQKRPANAGLFREPLMGFEPTTLCMASNTWAPDPHGYACKRTVSGHLRPPRAFRPAFTGKSWGGRVGLEVSADSRRDLTTMSRAPPC
jgi:hypothetical protein